MSQYLLISDAAKEVKVESHVLRYWEEELHLPIKRNELGHRYYTEEDVERFKQIKGMKERGLQLKAIKMILKDGRLDVLPQENEAARAETALPEGPEGAGETEESSPMAIHIVASREAETKVVPEDREEKSRRLQWLLQQLIRETLQENNQELSREIRECVIKELDYQFRAQEEREEERDHRQEQRTEEYYQRMDELLRSKSASRKIKKAAARQEKKKKGAAASEKEKEVRPIDLNTHKKKRHFIF